MAKVTTVKAARKPQGNCGRCGVEIGKGDAYIHASPGFRGPKLIRCTKHECRFRQSDLCTSKLAAIYAAQESAEDNLAELSADDATKGTFEEILEEVAAAAEEVGAEYQEASDAWADGQGHEEWQEWASECESYANTLRQIGSNLEEAPDEDDESEEGNALVLWFDEVLEQVEEAIGEFSL